MQTRRIPLDQIDVTDPCPVPWSDMADVNGDRRVRFCPHCRKNVHHLSAMPRGEAERLVCEAAGSLCVRFSRDDAGQVMTLDYQRPAGPRRWWRKWVGPGTVAGAVLAALGAVWGGRAVWSPPPTIQGMVSCPTTRPTATPVVPPSLIPATRPTGGSAEPDAPAADAPDANAPDSQRE